MSQTGVFIALTLSSVCKHPWCRSTLFRNPLTCNKPTLNRASLLIADKSECQKFCTLQNYITSFPQHYNGKIAAGEIVYSIPLLKLQNWVWYFSSIQHCFALKQRHLEQNIISQCGTLALCSPLRVS